MIFVPEQVAARLVTLADAIAAVEAAYRAFALGTAELFPVTSARGFNPGERWSLKSALDATVGAVGFKVGNHWPGNGARGVPAHGSTTILLDPATGFAKAVIGASHLTALRTAAADAVAVRHLARADAHVLAVVGAGHQAGWDVRAIAQVRRLDDIRIASRSTANAEALAALLRGEGLPARALPIEQAVRGADIVTTATAATAPIVAADWIAPGTHISAMGADAPGKQELPIELLKRASLFCDVRAQAVTIGEFELAVRDGLILPEQVTLVGDVIAGRAEGRPEAKAITVFDSSGMALQDLAIATQALAAAEAAGEAVHVAD